MLISHSSVSVGGAEALWTQPTVSTAIGEESWRRFHPLPGGGVSSAGKLCPLAWREGEGMPWPLKKRMIQLAHSFNPVLFSIQISSLLRLHPDLQQEFWDFFQQFHAPSSPVATVSDTIEKDFISENPSAISEDGETGSDSQEGEEPPVCAKNVSVSSNGEKVIVWTR